MSFDLAGLRAAVAREVRVVRVVVAAIEGSAPREVGAAMLVWADATGTAGQAGTIGGGALEHAAAIAARAMLASGSGSGSGSGSARRLTREALGPALGQCCGGVVTLLSEVWDQAGLEALRGPVVARPVTATAMTTAMGAAKGAVTGTDDRPLAVRRMLAAARGEGLLPGPTLIAGWMVEPVTVPARQIWVWGAGHVGRALVAVLAPLPGVAITWVDVDISRFPDRLPEGVSQLCAVNPGDLVAYAPRAAEHLVLTYSHALDLDLCHRLLLHGSGTVGLIGSATKWGRFRGRLRALGHADAVIARIECPIGDPALGKHPQAIAVGVAARLLARPLARPLPLQQERAG